MANGVEHAYEEQGSGSEAVLFSHGFLLNRFAYTGVMAELSHQYRCVSFDWRGQGGSGVPDRGYDVDTLVEDAAAIIERLGLGPCHFVGSSMGGWVGLRLATARPDLVRSLTLINSCADGTPRGKIPGYVAMGSIARVAGLRPLLGAVMKSLFGRPFLEDAERAEDRRFWMQQFLAHHRAGACRMLGGVVTKTRRFSQPSGINVPTLLIAGGEDPTFPPAQVRATAGLIPGAEVCEISGVGHAAAVEQPREVARALAGFLARA